MARNWTGISGINYTGVLHAPRQTGKTTFLQDWAREINSGGDAVSCYITVEACQGITDRAEVMRTINQSICASSKNQGLPIPELPYDEADLYLYRTMQRWAGQVAPKPLIVLIDETDVIEGEPLISFLRQLRSGFAERGVGKFPVSIALVGLRDLKDYITASKGCVAPNPGSPFNIKEDSIFISNFSKDDIAALFAQRTEETGQKIENDALDYIYEQSYGQPWIVNSLFQRATMRILKEDDYNTVTLAHIKEAREQMILARETHLDVLAYRLEDPRIRKMMDSIFTGDFDPELALSEAFHLSMDLGLVRLERGNPVVANPIYREIIARQLSFGPQAMIMEPEWKWENPDGSLDMDTLLKEFQQFWRENSEAWEEKMRYTEAFPHLLLMAFLQRVLNGGGHIDREYAAGRGRMDLFIEYNDWKYIIEIKLIHDKQSPETIRTKGIQQTAQYRDKITPAGTADSVPAYLVIFDRRTETKNKLWDERLSWDNENGITVVGC